MYSRLTGRYQTTIPQRVRELLRLKPGDLAKYEIADGLVLLSKATAIEVAKLAQAKRTVRESDTPEDAAAYDNL